MSNQDWLPAKLFLKQFWSFYLMLRPISWQGLHHSNLHPSLKLFPLANVMEAYLSSLLLPGLQALNCVISCSIFVGLLRWVNTLTPIFSGTFLLQPELISTSFFSLLHVLWNHQGSDLMMLLQSANGWELMAQSQIYHRWSRLRNVHLKLKTDSISKKNFLEAFVCK